MYFFSLILFNDGTEPALFLFEDSNRAWRFKSLSDIIPEK